MTITAPRGHLARLLAGGAIGWFAWLAAAHGFPLSDPTNPSVVSEPSTDSSQAPSEADLRHQLELHSPFATGAGGSAGRAWTFTPSLDLQGLWTDNVLQTQYDRRWDVGSVLTPGIAVVGDTPSAQVRLFYAPTLQMYARTPQENELTQSLDATSLFTLVPDALYVDARAFAGVQAVTPLAGQPGSFGSLGLLANGTNGLGLTKQQQAQTYSLTVSPYAMHRFGDAGTLKLGYSANETSSSSLTGFAAPLFASGGSNSQHAFTQEGLLQFQTGDAIAPWRNLFLIDGAASYGTGQLNNATRATVSNQLGYAITRTVAVFGQIGYEQIHYPAADGAAAVNVDDATWQVGTTLTPNPDSKITFAYGRQEGVTGVMLDARYAVTARTTLSARYNTGLTTALQSIQSELALADINQSGSFVDSGTGAPLFLGVNNGIGTLPGVYRAQTLTVSSSTTFDRDVLSVSFSGQRQQAVSVPTTIAASNGTTNTSWTVSGSWWHSLTPDLSGTLSTAYSIATWPGVGDSHQNAVSAGLSLQYMFTETLAGTASYQFFDRRSNIPGESIYVDMVVVGLSKRF